MFDEILRELPKLEVVEEPTRLSSDYWMTQPPSMWIIWPVM